MRMEKLTKAVLGGMALGALAAGTLAGNVSAAENTVRPQTIVMTDGEVDDMDSFMRFLLYTNDVDVRGIIYTSSEWHYKGDGKDAAIHW